MPHPEAIAAIVRGDHGDPFSLLGPHPGATPGTRTIRAFLPEASAVDAIDARTQRTLGSLALQHPGGFFSGTVRADTEPLAYRLRLTVGDRTYDIEDPYRFGLVLGDVDVYLISEGRHMRLYEKLGAHPATFDGVAGTTFAVWAPSARRVSVVGDFNDWDGRRNVMRSRGSSGVWEIFLPCLGSGATYKFEVLDAHGGLLPLRADPFGFAAERPPATASIVAIPGRTDWNDADWLAERHEKQHRNAPIAIYEVHLGSWKRAGANRYLTYAELAGDLVPYVASLGFTHIELMPVAEHPFDGSWGYQTIGMYAPTSRFGTPADFAAFVDRAHAAGLGVLLDWVPGHFPTDAHGLGSFDGSHLYEHADPRQGFQPDWNTLIFNFDRNEVVNYLIANAIFWLEAYHIDGLRVDAVASMLYLDFSRKADEWIPNAFGGRENLGAIRFLQRTNEAVYGECAGAVTMAEESSDWPKVSLPVEYGGLGFGYKWNMGWMHDTLDFMHVDPLYRRYHQDKMTFGFMYAFSENFVLPLSHDEIVYGKGSLIEKMPGDDWQRFANLRAYFGYMYAHPGKKLLFMGGEFAQWREWNHDRSLDWHLLEDERHAGVQRLIGDLNRLYRESTALYELDAEAAGLDFIRSDKDANVIAFVRRGRTPGDVAVAIANFTPVVRYNYRFGVPEGGAYVEAINTDERRYGGSGVTNGLVYAEEFGLDGKPYSLNVTLPPLGTIVFRRQ